MTCARSLFESKPRQLIAGGRAPARLAWLPGPNPGITFAFIESFANNSVCLLEQSQGHIRPPINTQSQRTWEIPRNVNVREWRPGQSSGAHLIAVPSAIAVPLSPRPPLEEVSLSSVGAVTSVQVQRESSGAKKSDLLALCEDCWMRCH